MLALPEENTQKTIFTIVALFAAVGLGAVVVVVVVTTNLAYA
jgi:hypothetical protein